MPLPASRAIAPHLELVPEVSSTNEELAARASATDLPDFTVLATTNQTAGRGRLGRDWVSPPDTTIAVSVLLAPAPGLVAAVGWLPLLTGLAMTRAVRDLLPGRAVALKWPNDVQVDGLKVCGILGQAVPGRGLIIGAGLNLTMTAEQLPVPTATSLTLEGADPDDLVDRALAAYLGRLRETTAAFAASGYDPEAGLRSDVSAACGSLGRAVRVHLPTGEDVTGEAESIDREGRLVVRTDTGVLEVSAGDVTHLRYE